MKSIRCLVKMLGFRVGTQCSIPRCENFGGWQTTENSVSGPKNLSRTQNGISQKWSQIGRSNLYGRDTATLGFGGWNVRFLSIQTRSESDCPASLIFLRGPAARLYFIFLQILFTSENPFFVPILAFNRPFEGPGKNRREKIDYLL